MDKDCFYRFCGGRSDAATAGNMRAKFLEAYAQNFWKPARGIFGNPRAKFLKTARKIFGNLRAKFFLPLATAAADLLRRRRRHRRR